MSLFGSRDWSHVHREITKRVSRNFPRAGKHNVEDAVQTAIMNLFVVWRHYPSTIKVDDTQRLFAYAVMWGTGRAQQYLIQELRRHETEVSFDRPLTGEDPDASTLWDLLPDRLPTPEELFFEDDELEELHRAVEQMSDDDLRNWLLPIARGEGVSQQARRERIDHAAISRRRVRGVRRLREVLCA